jgi:amyloid beta precursor protein binding protein 1
VSAVQARVKNILQSVGKPDTFITFEETKKFCKNALFLLVVRYRSLADEYSNPKSNLFSSELDTNLSFYIALRAVDEFYTKNKRYPGNTDATVEADTTAILSESADLLKRLGVAKYNTDHIVELYVNMYFKKTNILRVQYGGAELHNMASLLGGVASQEVIKIVTHQYTPIDNTFIFNGLNSSSSVFSL